MNTFKTKYMPACLDNGGNEQGHQVGPDSGKKFKVEEGAQKKRRGKEEAWNEL